MSATPQNPRLAHLDMIRGAAALAVCAFHLVPEALKHASLLGAIADWGYLGVDAFFVVSGFVIPLALKRSRERAESAMGFLKRRFWRLYPCFAAAIVLNLVLWQTSALLPGFRGQSLVLTFEQLAANFLLIGDLIGQPWYSPVFWTLAIEAQFYLLVVLLYRPLTAPSPAIRYLTLTAWTLAPFLYLGPGTVLVFTTHFLPGILWYLHRYEGMNTLAALGFCLAGAMVQWLYFDAPTVTATLLAAIAVALPWPVDRAPLRHLTSLGTISYSLYLTHTALGGRVLNLTARFSDSPIAQLAAAAGGLLVSIIGAMVFYVLFEKPAMKRASSNRA